MEFFGIIAVAVLIEALVEYFKTIAKAFADKEYKIFATQAFTVAIGIFMAFAFGANVFPQIGLEVNATIGTVITGIIMSRGSNYASDLIGKLTK